MKHIAEQLNLFPEWEDNQKQEKLAKEIELAKFKFALDKYTWEELEKKEKLGRKDWL